MAVKNVDEIIESFKTIVGENTDDAVVNFLEDIADTFASFEDSENWQTKYEENDREWRKKYIARFSNNPDGEPDGEPDGGQDSEPPTTYAELFKED